MSEHESNGYDMMKLLHYNIILRDIKKQKMIKIIVINLFALIAVCKEYTCEFGKLYPNATNSWVGKPD